MPREKKNYAGTSHQGFPWSLLLGFVALKVKKAFILLAPACQTERSCLCLASRACFPSGILCGFLLLHSSRANRTVFISWYHSNFLSGSLLNLAVPEAPRRSDSEGKFKHCKLLEKQGIPSLRHTCTRPDNLQVRKGSTTADQCSFPKSWKESTSEITSACKQRSYIMGSCSSCLEKKHNLNFQVHSNKNIFKIQGLIADKFLLNALNNLVLHFKATSLISISVLCWRRFLRQQA